MFAGIGIEAGRSKTYLLVIILFLNSMSVKDISSVAFLGIPRLFDSLTRFCANTTGLKLAAWLDVFFLAISALTRSSACFFPDIEDAQYTPIKIKIVQKIEDFSLLQGRWKNWLTNQGKRRRSRPLDRRVRPEGQKGAPCLGQGRSLGKTAGPRKRRSAARMIAGSACCTRAGGPKGLKAFGTGRSAEISGCAHRAGDGTNALSSAAAVGGRLRRTVSP